MWRLNMQMQIFALTPVQFIKACRCHYGVKAPQTEPQGE